METEKILDLMQSGPRERTVWTVLPVLYAQALSEISSRLNEEELHHMIAIGAAINDCVCNEIRSSIEANARLKKALSLTVDAIDIRKRDPSLRSVYAWKRLSIACNRAILHPGEKIQASKWAALWAHVAGFHPK